MRIAIALVIALLAAPALAKLPPVSPEAKAKADEAAAKTTWGDKVGAYQTCLAQDRAVQNFRKNAMQANTVIPAPSAPTALCVDPGPYVSALTAQANKPLEASGAHSPPGLAVSPPSSSATAAEITGGTKKK